MEVQYLQIIHYLEVQYLQIIRYLEVHYVQISPLLEVLYLQITYYFRGLHSDFGIVGEFRRETTVGCGGD